MALTFTRTAASPSMVRIRVTSESGANSDVIPASTIANTYCVAGPLKELLLNPAFQPSPGQGPNPNAWDSEQSDARISCAMTGYGLTPQPCSFKFNISVPGARDVNLYVGGTGSAIFEMRYENTLVR